MLAAAPDQPYAEDMRKILVALTTAMLMALAFLTPAIVWAQTAAPAPTLKRAPPVWLGYLLIAVLLVIVMAVSLMPSKRSHQD